MKFEHLNQGTCSRKILLDVEDNKIVSCEFIGGCNGNLQGICKLVKGQDIDEVIDKMQGIRCGYKSTSCPDQLASALKEYKTRI